MKFYTALLLSFLAIHITTINVVLGEEQDSLKAKSKIVAYPFGYYTKETSIAFGGAALMYLKQKRQSTDNKQISTIQLTTVYTINKQYNLEFWYQLFFKKDKYRLQGFTDYNDFPYYYYGIGSNTKKENQEFYQTIFFRFRSTFQKQLIKSLFLGVSYWNEYYFLKKFSTCGMLQLHPKEGYISSLGPTLTIDTRDNIFYPNKGVYWEINYLNNHPYLGSTYNYRRIHNDFRIFRKIAPNLILAYQLFMQNMIGDVPFNQLAVLGGPKFLRGYYLGRFRDKNSIINQLELRGKLSDRWGATLFGGIGSVFSEFNKSIVANSKVNYGLGFRYKLTKSQLTNIRLDFAFGSMGNRGVYIIIDEAF